ncbi:helix-turn-helix transcriptional regulator [Microbacterium betulae]|uniref:Helix-turn-helix transcriptional regulator n=1 Tax=Microbacterium betulae TaxID=2981139 RepID=A0AA97FHP9_9MICO|nr:helix-turn-helix transcriptional regulator [Microbacterium sp. AB]WOF23098.1 helix-turn-helix transcriptional regulator [Microbacterium sp. AB]
MDLPHDVTSEIDRALRDADLDAIESMSDRLWYALPAAAGRELADLLSALPRQAILRRPRLLLLFAQSSQFSDGAGDVTLRHLLRAFTVFAPHFASAFATMEDPDEALVAGMFAVIGLRLDGELYESEATAQKLERTLRLHARAGRSTTSRPGWLPAQRALTAMLRGRFTEAFGFARRAYEEAGPTPHQQTAGKDGAGYAALLAAFAGSRDVSLGWLSKHAGIDGVPNHIHPLVDAAAILARAVLALDALDTDSARAYLQEFGPSAGGYEIWPYIAMVWSRHDQILGNTATGLARMDDIMFANAAPSDADTLAGGLLLRARADLLLEAGEGTTVISLARQHPHAPMLQIAAARAHLRAGDFADALRIASIPGLARGATRRDTVDLLLISASAHLRRDESDEAARDFAQAIECFAFTGDVSTFREIDDDDRRRLCALVGVDDPLASILPHLSPRCRAAVRVVQLSPRERVVLRELATDAPLDAIAVRLSVSINTVKTQTRRIYRALGATSREEAVLLATQQGLLAASPSPSTAEGGIDRIHTPKG